MKPIEYLVKALAACGALAMFAHHFHLTTQQLIDQVSNFVSHGPAVATQLLGIRF
jgi:hypothetical protein